MKKLLSITLAVLMIGAASLPVHADDTQAAINAMESYLEFVDYGGATIFPASTFRH
jgi:hypothetical protein